MRLGLLGPAPDHDVALADAARRLRTELKVDRVLYLGPDRKLDAIVGTWAEELVGPDARDETIMARMTERCLSAPPFEIDEFLQRERERSDLRAYESLQGEVTRSVEMVGGKVAVMLYDKAYLEEDDILPATLLIFGKSRDPLLKVVGRRWFLSPGSFPDHGIMVVDDAGEHLRATIYDKDLKEIEAQVLSAPKTLRMRATGDN